VREAADTALLLLFVNYFTSPSITITITITILGARGSGHGTTAAVCELLYQSLGRNGTQCNKISLLP
jgi:hypothetical protein